MKECSLLMGLEEEEQNLLVDELDPNAMDVERWDLGGVGGGGVEHRDYLCFTQNLAIPLRKG